MGDKASWLVWESFIIEHDYEILHQYLDMIKQWKTLIDLKIDERADELNGQNDLPQWVWDSLTDEASMAQYTERVIYASLGVSVFSVIEKAIGRFCKYKNISLDEKPNWGKKKNELEKCTGVKFENIPGFDVVTKARILNNCFKHEGGRANNDFISEYGGNLNDEIEYEKEDWQNIIKISRQFLEEFAEKFFK